MGQSHKPGFSGYRRLGGGAGPTRTNHQSVMEHGSCPTNYPGRTPIQIVGRFVVLFDFPPSRRPDKNHRHDPPVFNWAGSVVATISAVHYDEISPSQIPASGRGRGRVSGRVTDR